MDLQFVKENFRMTHLNVRTETHGDEDVKAVDMKFEADMHNSVLDKLSPGLRTAIYTQDEGAVVDMINPDHAPHLRNPIFETKFKLGCEMQNGRLEIHDDNDLGNFVFKETKARNFQIMCKEGGSVHLSFSVPITDPSANDLTAMYLLLNETLKISLEEIKEELPSNSDDGNVVDASLPIEESNVHPLFNPKATSVIPGDDDDAEPTEEELAADEAARQKAMGMNVE